MAGFECIECKKSFSSQQALEQHNNSKHQMKAAKTSKKTLIPKNSKTMKHALIAVSIAAVIGIGYFFIAANPAPTDPRVPNYPIHWHPKLAIAINGQEQLIPSGLGATGSIHLPIHTHDATGTLHYENNNPSFENMRLGYFFEKAWKKTFNSSCIFEYCNNEKSSIKMFVNGAPNTEFENFVPKEGDNIRIEYS